MNDRNHRACSHKTLLNFAVSLFERRHSESIDATKMPLRYGTSKFLYYSGYHVRLTRGRSQVRGTNFVTIVRTVRNSSFITILFA